VSILALYGVTIFTSAALLFFIQPIFARMALPLLGGSPAVWNTAMVFFQAALLAGYAYAHASVAWLGVRRQAALHLLILLLPIAILPIAIPAGWTPPPGNPIAWLLGLMVVCVGLPFFAVSTTSPVVQAWFAATRHRQAADPYFLYAASNVGSMLALMSYPLWVEPALPLTRQSRAWAWGYGCFVLLVAGCAAWLWRSTRRHRSGGGAASEAASRGGGGPAAPLASERGKPAKPAAAQRLRWILLAFVPSSLLLSVTLYLSSEIAPVPLLWIVPMAIYLLTFILAFARRPLLAAEVWGRALVLLVVPLVLVMNMRATQPIGWLMALHLVTFFVAALICHRELAASRPAAAHLTEFYLWISLGGALGGVFSALVAPLIFNSVAEYPLTLILACAVCLPRGQDAYFDVARPLDSALDKPDIKIRVLPPSITVSDIAWPAGLALLAIGLVLAAQSTPLLTAAVAPGAVFAGPALICYSFSRRPLRFTLGVAALLLAAQLYYGGTGRVLFAERSFFGVHRVTLDPTGRFHILLHGKTTHGMQSLDPARRHEALAYFYRTGPIGDVLALYGRGEAEQVAVVGLGAGSLASYGQPGQAWTYFEIDPVVLKIARDPRFFSFLRDSWAQVDVVLGDARLSLVGQPDGKFDLIIIDAYSSDAIPIHLVTREALALYLRKLAPGGRLAFHISNQHLDLEPVFGNLARDADLTAVTRADTNVSAREVVELGKAPSLWLVMARQPDEIAALAHEPGWRPSRRNDRQAVWTDDYSSVMSVFRWQ